MTVKLTPKGAATRDRIIAGASAEIRENGVTATLDDIRVRTGTSKSQLFHYFPDGREQLLLAVARYEADRVLADQQPQLGDLTSWASWQAWRDAVVARYREQGQQCPLSALTTQLGRATPGAQAVVSELIGQWQAEIAAGVRHMQAAGEIAAELDPVRTAAAIVAGIQGGVVMLMSTGDTTPLEAALDLSIAYLRASLGGFGVGLESGHRPDILPVEAAGDRPPQEAQDQGHGDVQDQPPGHFGAVAFPLE
jgi:AcrR family transcriptional regulator